MEASVAMSSAQSPKDAAYSPKRRRVQWEGAAEQREAGHGVTTEKIASGGDESTVGSSNGVGKKDNNDKDAVEVVSRDGLHAKGVSDAANMAGKVAEEITEANQEAVRQNGAPKEQQKEQAKGVSNGHREKIVENAVELNKARTSVQVARSDGETVHVSEEMQNTAMNNVIKDARATNQSPPTQAVHITGVDMVFPEDEVPIELCPFSSDGSVEPSRSMRAASIDSSPGTQFTSPPKPVESTPTTPVTTEDVANHTVGKRKRRKKLSYSSARSKTTGKTKDEQPLPVAAEEKLSVSVNDHADENEAEVDADGNPPPSPVYPDADASHLYPSNPEGTPWQWEDCESYFAPLQQNDMDNLVRWRKECAKVLVAYPFALGSGSESTTKRAVLEAMIADAPSESVERVEPSERRGRSYRDIWEETDFLAKQKRTSSAGENSLKSQVVKKKRKSLVDSEVSLLSHRDLVYGYDDDLFQDFKGRLEDCVKACRSDPSPPSTPPTPPMKRPSQATNTNKTDETIATAIQQEVVFDEEVLPSLPCQLCHPASIGLWKLRKKQEADFSVIHPASLRRADVPVRWKEEMERHHQQQYELQLQQTDELADPSDGDDEGAGTDGHHRATLLNSDIHGALPSFGETIEEDEISQALAASVAKLLPLAICNWRTTQLVHDRAACSVQCAPILEGEAAAARELEDVYLQLCPPGDNTDDATTMTNGVLARQPRGTQINSVPYDLLAYSLRGNVADTCSLAVAVSVEFALGVNVGDVVDVLDRNGCWNYGEVIEVYSENSQGIPKFLLLRFSLWAEDTVEWIAVSEGRLLPRGVADGSRPCTVGPTRAHRGRVRYDQSLARELERSFPQRRVRQGEAVAEMLAHRQHTATTRSLNDHQKTPQKRKRKRPGKSAVVASTV